MKKIIYILSFYFLFSCEYISVQRKAEKIKPSIVSVYDVKLYKSDIKDLIPKNMPKQDSLVLVKSIINSWAKKQLLLKKAEENSTEVNNKEITSLVQKYKESLFINSYKKRLIQQRLDTVISEQEIANYYAKNNNNFRLNENLLQLKYIHFGKDFLDKKETIKKFKSTKEEDLENLEKQELNFKSYNLNDSTWVTLNDVLLKIPPFRKEAKEKLLKTSKFIQKEDSLGLYLVTVKKVLKRNDIAPLSYITPTIKQMILHKRKLKLIRKIEKTLINDAIKNKHFKEY